ncbi:hypothetical protein CKA32_005279 [Geitlerinema sp. FC II]|nr:hypothetical protein CKA32_005279 [Geitlerinema sp. FC II]
MANDRWLHPTISCAIVLRRKNVVRPGRATFFDGDASFP